MALRERVPKRVGAARTSENSVKRKFNFGEFTFYALR